MYHLGLGNLLYESVYSEVFNRWQTGNLHIYDIILDSNSSIAAIPLHDDGICIYYQGRWQDPFIEDPLNNYFKIDPNTDFIRRVYRLPKAGRSGITSLVVEEPEPLVEPEPLLPLPYRFGLHDYTGCRPWFKDNLPIAKAVKGSSIAVIQRPSTTGQVSCIFYQDPELHLRERNYDELGSMDKWVLGEQHFQIYPLPGTHPNLGNFNPGVQPRGTPITAEAVDGKDVDINVTWRDSRGRVASSSWSKSSGWDLLNMHDGETPLDGRDWGTFENRYAYFLINVYEGSLLFAIMLAKLPFRISTLILTDDMPFDRPMLIRRVQQSSLSSHFYHGYDSEKTVGGSTSGLYFGICSRPQINQISLPQVQAQANSAQSIQRKCRYPPLYNVRHGNVWQKSWNMLQRSCTCLLWWWLGEGSKGRYELHGLWRMEEIWSHIFSTLPLFDGLQIRAISNLVRGCHRMQLQQRFSWTRDADKLYRKHELGARLLDFFCLPSIRSTSSGAPIFNTTKVSRSMMIFLLLTTRWASPEIPALDAMAISIPQFHFVPTHICVSISWNNGNEVCLLGYGDLNWWSHIV